MAIINILMDGDKSVCAFFKKKKYTLTIIVNNGIVTGAGVYDTKTVVNIQATANTGYQFDHWSGDLSGSVNPTTILMNSNKTITANFVLIPVVQYTLATSVDPVDSGTVTGAGTYDTGTNVTIEATPAIDYDFDHWNGVTGKWSGLGMGIWSAWFPEDFDSWVDTLLANGFTELRVDVPDYQNTEWFTRSKAAVIRAVAKGINVIWGVNSNKWNNPDYTITSTNWPTFRAAILSAAQWAQDNGVFEFQLGNELEMSIDGTTLTITQLIANLKSVATEVQAIFTNGNVSYSCWQNVVSSLNPWIAAGRGNIDIIASNIYKGGSSDAYDLSYQDRIASLITAFGADHTYLTEFGPSYTSLLHYSTDEAVQAAAVTEMIDYIKASGMTRAIFFCWRHDSFGAMYENGTYRLLWNSLIGK